MQDDPAAGSPQPGGTDPQSSSADPPSAERAEVQPGDRSEAATDPGAVATLDVADGSISAGAPEAGAEALGTIPASHSRRAWARAQVANWRLFLVRFLSSGVAVVVTVAVLPGLGFTGWHWGQGLLIALVFGLLNATVKPLLQFLVLRFIFSTYGIVVVIINAILLAVLALILEDTFVAYRPIAVFAGGALVGALALILETLLGATPPVLDRDYLDRNALT